jgi:hypothetical protein
MTEPAPRSVRVVATAAGARLETTIAQKRPRRLWRWALVALAALGVVGGRVLHDSWAALTAGEDAERRNAPVEAAREYLHAVRMYLPGSPFVRRALDRLESMAGAAARAGDVAGERRALEAIRAGLLGARSFYTPNAERLPAVDRRLAAIYARLEDRAVAAGASLAAREAWHLGRLERRPGPATGWALAALGGCALWIGAAVTFIRRGVDRSLRLRPRWAVGAGVAFVIGFALFMAGLRLA